MLSPGHPVREATTSDVHVRTPVATTAGSTCPRAKGVDEVERRPRAASSNATSEAAARVCPTKDTYVRLCQMHRCNVSLRIGGDRTSSDPPGPARSRPWRTRVSSPTSKATERASAHLTQHDAVGVHGGRRRLAPLCRYGATAAAPRCVDHGPGGRAPGSPPATGGGATSRPGVGGTRATAAHTSGRRSRDPLDVHAIAIVAHSRFKETWHWFSQHAFALCATPPPPAPPKIAP